MTNGKTCETCGLLASTIGAVGGCGLKRHRTPGERCMHVELTKEKRLAADMTPVEGSDWRRKAQAELESVFREFGLDVATGITAKGIMIGSQDERVEARWLGEVVPYEDDVGTQQWVKLLQLTTAYLQAAEAMIDGLQGMLGVDTREPNAQLHAAQEVERRVEAYASAKNALVGYAQAMQGVLSA